MPHPLTNFEIERYYQNNTRFNDVYSRDNVPNKIKDEVYIINHYKHANIGPVLLCMWTVVRRHLAMLWYILIVLESSKLQKKSINQ